MPKHRDDEDFESQFDDDDYADYAEEFSEDDLELLLELMDDYPELDQYLDDILSLDDEDFYEG
jgi:hypothetical protein